MSTVQSDQICPVRHLVVPHSVQSVQSSLVASQHVLQGGSGQSEEVFDFGVSGGHTVGRNGPQLLRDLLHQLTEIQDQRSGQRSYSGADRPPAAPRSSPSAGGDTGSEVIQWDGQAPPPPSCSAIFSIS